MSAPRKLQVESLAGLTQQNIRAPADKLGYNELVIAKVEELFAADPQATKHLIGIDLDGFTSRTQEFELFTELKKRGFGFKTVMAGTKSGKNTGVLITRLEPTPQASE